MEDIIVLSRDEFDARSKKGFHRLYKWVAICGLMVYYTTRVLIDGVEPHWLIESPSFKEGDLIVRPPAADLFGLPTPLYRWQWKNAQDRRDVHVGKPAQEYKPDFVV